MGGGQIVFFAKRQKVKEMSDKCEKQIQLAARECERNPRSRPATVNDL